jgi:hypothetical protein
MWTYFREATGTNLAGFNDDAIITDDNDNNTIASW